MTRNTDADAAVDALHRIFRAVDSRDWKSYRSLMADQITVDYGDVADDVAGEIPADQIVQRTRGLLEPLPITQHAVFNQIVEVDGDVATIRFYERALHYHPSLSEDERTNSWILYADCTRQFRKETGGWKMISASVRRIRDEGNPQILRDARAFAEGSS